MADKLGAYGARTVHSVPASIAPGETPNMVSATVLDGWTGFRGKVPLEATTTATISISKESAEMLPSDAAGRSEICMLIDSGENTTTNGNRRVHHLVQFPYATQEFVDKTCQDKRRDDHYRLVFRLANGENNWFGNRTLGLITRCSRNAQRDLATFTAAFDNLDNNLLRALRDIREHQYIRIGIGHDAVPILYSPLHSGHANAQQLLRVFTDRLTLFSRAMRTTRSSMSSNHDKGYSALISQGYNTIVVPHECVRHAMPLYAAATIYPNPRKVKDIVLHIADAGGIPEELQLVALRMFFMAFDEAFYNDRIEMGGNITVADTPRVINTDVSNLTNILRAMKDPRLLLQDPNNMEDLAVVDAIMTIASIGNVRTFLIAGDPYMDTGHSKLREILPVYRARLVCRIIRSGINFKYETQLPEEPYAADPKLVAGGVRLPLVGKLPDMERVLISIDRQPQTVTS